MLAFAITASLLVSALGPPVPARAEPAPDPAARLQVVLKKIHINNDRDGWARGSGEIRVYTEICPRNGPADTESSCEGGTGVQAIWDFSAESGQDVYPNVVVPADGDLLFGEASSDLGVPVYAGQYYLLQVGMLEFDDIGGDKMGKFVYGLGAETGWAIGTHTQGGSAHSDGAGPDSPDFVVTYEIRRAPLPDLVMQQAWVDGPTGTAFVCGEIRNVGARPAAAGVLTARTEGKIVDTFTLPALDVGWSYPHCIRRSVLPARKHNLVFSIDEARAIPEMDELNNVGVQTVEAVAAAAAETVSGVPAAVPSPEPNRSVAQARPSGAQPDLSVRTIKVNGQAPDGKDDCKIGKNQVTVVVKNNGDGDSGSFTTRLIVDGDETDATVDNVRAGEEREVRFENVQMKKGERTLKAVADAERTIDESNEGNNDAKVSARCTDGG